MYPSTFDTVFCHHESIKRKHQRNLELIFSRPASANVHWADIEALLRKLVAEFEEREGSRVEVLLGLVRVFHRRHPSADTDKGAVAAHGQSLNQWATEAIRQAASTY